MKRLYTYIYCILTGILLWLSWTPSGFAFLSFAALVPLFFASERLVKREIRHPFLNGFWYSFIAFFVWNAGTTWWVSGATVGGAIAMLIANSMLMATVFGCWQCFRSLKQHPIADATAFIAFWGAWEYLHLNWVITWPWLNLGNVFASCTEYVQWYEITGTFGGTLWILVANFLIYNLIRRIIADRSCSFGKKNIILATALVLWIALPMAGSIIRYKTYQIPDDRTAKAVEAVVVQQNTEPHHEQYSMSNLEHAQRLNYVAETAITPETKIVVCAESALPWQVSTDMLRTRTYPDYSETYSGFSVLEDMLQQHPGLNLIVGLSTSTLYETKRSPYAQEVQLASQWVDTLGFDSTKLEKVEGKYVTSWKLYEESYNSSVCFSSKPMQMYHKSKLVPGVERLPSFLEKFAIDLGGTSGSLGNDSIQRVFELDGVPFKVGVPVCYESAYGEHFAKFVRNGAELMAVITNDGWWGETPGYRQHFLFSKLRAVETRRTIMRAANTGTSAFIDERGDVHQATRYNTRTAIRQKVCPNQALTFYAKHGDYLAHIFVAIAALTACWGCYRKLKGRRRGSAFVSDKHE